MLTYLDGKDQGRRKQSILLTSNKYNITKQILVGSMISKRKKMMSQIYTTLSNISTLNYCTSSPICSPVVEFILDAYTTAEESYCRELEVLLPEGQ